MPQRIPNTIKHPKRGRLVCRIYDNGGETQDRYTACFKALRCPHNGLYWPYVSFNSSPFHPLGFGQYGEAREFLDFPHLGKRIAFEDLPAEAQKFVLQSI